VRDRILQDFGVPAGRIPCEAPPFCGSRHALRRRIFVAEYGAGKVLSRGGTRMLGRLALQCKQPLGNILRGMSTGSAGEHGPVYKGIIATLETALEPTELRLVDDSAKHAGHAAMKDAAEKQGQAVRESHFRLEVVSQRFEGLSRVKRHQMVRLSLPTLKSE
jgi:stress-induced morphogen